MTTIDMVRSLPRIDPDRHALGPTKESGMALVELGRFDRMAAHIVVGRLDSEGIAAIAFDGESSVGDGSWLIVPVRVMVDEADAATARTVLAEPPAPDWPAEPD